MPLAGLQPRLYHALQQARAASELLAVMGTKLASSLELDELREDLVGMVVLAFADWCVLDVVEPGFRQRVVRRVHGDVPILVITAGGRAREKAERVGALAHLAKPFVLHAQLAIVRDKLPEG